MRLAVAACAALVALAGCGTPIDDTGTVQASSGAPETVKSFWTRAVDGRRVPCVWASGGNSGGLSCDWGAR